MSAGVRREDRVAWLHERPTADGAWWSATFGCDLGPRGPNGPTAVDLAEALAWGREHAATVMLFLGDRPGCPFSAGELPAKDPRTPAAYWPQLPDGFIARPRPNPHAGFVRYEPSP